MTVFEIVEETESLEQTRALAERLAVLLRAGDVVLLDGPLGAGKTTLVRAVAGAIGIDPSVVSSPTFVVANEYPNPTGPDLVHVDAYRLGSADDLDALGWDRLNSGETIVLIEWGERLSEALGDAARLVIEPTGETSRRFRLSAPDAWGQRTVGADRQAANRPTTCPVTGAPVSADSPTWPFASEQARMADLYRWFSGQHVISRPIEQADLEQGE